MCTTRWIHKEIKLRYNKLNSNHKRSLPSPYIDDIIKKSTFDYIDLFATGNNLKKFKVGFEVTQQRMDMLSTLVVPEETLDGTLFNDDIGIYEFKLKNLTNKYFHKVRVFYYDKVCNKIVPITIVTHDELDNILRSDLDKPSKKWDRLIAKFATDSDTSTESSLYVYTNKEFELSSITIEYIRCPAKAFVGGYDTLEYLEGDEDAPNQTSAVVNPDIPDKYCDVLVSICVQNLARILYDKAQLEFTNEDLLSKI